MNRILTAVAISAALLVPTYLIAQEHDHEQDQHQRYYDKHHKDYHQFDDNENRAFSAYAQQQHHADWQWAKMNERQQQQYWDWRHNHSDAVLQINVR